MRTWIWLIAVGLGLSAGMANAAEVSFLSGLYKQEKEKFNGDKAGETTEIEVGGRFADEYDVGMDWFGQATLTLRNYDEPKGGKAPSDSTNLELGGGLRMNFDSYSEAIGPFAYGMVAYKNDKEAEFEGLGYRETETSGLFYSMHAGMRFRFDQNLFLDLEAPLFESALTGTTKVETDDGAGNDTKTETTKTELFVDGQAPLGAVTIVLGMKI